MEGCLSGHCRSASTKSVRRRKDIQPFRRAESPSIDITSASLLACGTIRRDRFARTPAPISLLPIEKSKVERFGNSRRNDSLWRKHSANQLAYVHGHSTPTRGGVTPSMPHWFAFRLIPNAAHSGTLTSFDRASIFPRLANAAKRAGCNGRPSPQSMTSNSGRSRPSTVESFCSVDFPLLPSPAGGSRYPSQNTRSPRKSTRSI